MRRIIQKYNEGSPGAVGPAVATGIPQGGHAAAAIQSYLSGQAAGPLSYSSTTGGNANQTRLDYHAAAKILRDKRIADAAAAAAAAAVVNNDSNDDSGDGWDEMDSAASYVPSSGYTSTNPSDVSYTGNTPGQMSNTSYNSGSLFSGGGADGFGNYGVLGDIGGAIGDALNITNYDGSQEDKPSGNQGGWENSGWNPKNWNNGGDVTSDIQRYNNGSTGGVSIAKSGNEEEIRQRQLMSSPLPKAKESPLSGIGEGLMTSAINNGVSTGLATMAGKEGLAGTLGTMMGSGGVGATAATGGLGAGMMATLGPIGIGLGIGKLFGLFNDGGKVPYTKLKKSPLSGE